MTDGGVAPRQAAITDAGSGTKRASGVSSGILVHQSTTLRISVVFPIHARFFEID
jgi:hypothetical protein